MRDIHATREKAVRRIAGKVNALLDELFELYDALGPYTVMVPGAQRTREIEDALKHLDDGVGPLIQALELLDPSTRDSP
jgi:hypothetical protein